MKRSVGLDIDLERIDHDEIEALYKAVGRLIFWAPDRYPTVNIYNDGINDLIAYYSNTGEQTRYVIGAVWRVDRYTFHS